MKRLLFIATGTFLLHAAATAQDTYYTQYLGSPLTMNPALTGLTTNDYRVSAIYRNDAFSSLNDQEMTTQTVSCDASILKGKLPEGDALGVGIIGFYDRFFGDHSNAGGISLAYHKALGSKKQHHLSVGVQAVLTNKLQHDTYYDTAFNAYPLTRDNTYSNSNFGIVYSGKISSRSSLSAGFSYYRYGPPKYNPYPSAYLSPAKDVRMVAFVNGSYELNKKIILLANALYYAQREYPEWLIGMSAGLVLNNNTDINKKTILYAGLWRRPEVTSPYLAIEFSKMKVGLSYDLYLPDLKYHFYEGSVELSVTYSGLLNKKGTNNTPRWIVPKMNQ